MVAIKDFGMPSCCFNCEMRIDGWSAGYYCAITEEELNDNSTLEHRHPNCPLVEIGTCKDCKHNKMSHNSITLCYTKCDLGHRFELREPSTFYCADFEKRGSENE